MKQNETDLSDSILILREAFLKKVCSFLTLNIRTKGKAAHRSDRHLSNSSGQFKIKNPTNELEACGRLVLMVLGVTTTEDQQNSSRAQGEPKAELRQPFLTEVLQDWFSLLLENGFL